MPDPLPPHLTIPKQQYDVFSNPDADRVIASPTPRETRPSWSTESRPIIASSARWKGLLDRGRKVAIVADAIRRRQRGRVAHDDSPKRGVLLSTILRHVLEVFP